MLSQIFWETGQFCCVLSVVYTLLLLFWPISYLPSSWTSSLFSSKIFILYKKVVLFFLGRVSGIVLIRVLIVVQINNVHSTCLFYIDSCKQCALFISPVMVSGIVLLFCPWCNVLMYCLTNGPAETVIYRIYYYINRSGNGRLTMRELKRGNIIDAMQHADEEEDINKVLR